MYYISVYEPGNKTGHADNKSYTTRMKLTMKTDTRLPDVDIRLTVDGTMQLAELLDANSTLHESC